MMKSIKCLYAASLSAIGSTAAMAQASYTDKDGNEYQTSLLQSLEFFLPTDIIPLCNQMRLYK